MRLRTEIPNNCFIVRRCVSCVSYLQGIIHRLINKCVSVVVGHFVYTVNKKLKTKNLSLEFSLQHNYIYLKSFVADLQWLHFSAYCSDEQKLSWTLWHHGWMYLLCNRAHFWLHPPVMLLSVIRCSKRLDPFNQRKQ